MKYLVAIVSLSALVSLHGKAEQGHGTVDVEKKMEIMRALVTKAVPFFKKQGVEESCKAFTRDLRWRRGEIDIFVFNSAGICYLFGQDSSLIWKDFHDNKRSDGESFIPEMLQVGKEGDMVTFRWNNSTMHAYVRTVEKDGETYIIGAGFYPASAAFSTRQLVKSAVRYGETHSAEELFEQINNPHGMFVYGDVYLYAYDFEGNVVAHGESKELVGQNLIDERTSDGRYRAREMIAIAKSREGEGWYSYKSMQGDLVKRVYVHRFIDRRTDKSYMIAGGYYPEIDANTIIGLVKRAASYLRSNGAERAFPEFSKRLGIFATGSAMLFAYDMQGVTRADMANPAFIGLASLVNSVDMQGKPIVKIILEEAKRNPNGAWVSFSLNNTLAMIYIEKVTAPDGDFVIGANYYPIEKSIHVRFMVDRAVLFLKNGIKELVFDTFTSEKADYFRGDLSVFVYNPQGIIEVDGNKRSRIWKDDSVLRDDKGRLISDKVTAIARSGGGWFEYMFNNATRRIYVDLVEKETGNDEPEKFIVGSGYYL
jgi:cytochrome c